MNMDLQRAREQISKAFRGFREQAALSHAYHDVYATPQGKVVFEDLMRKGGMLETSPDPADSRFFEGRRSLALEICKALRWTESEMITLAQAQTREDLERLVE